MNVLPTLFINLPDELIKNIYVNIKHGAGDITVGLIHRLL